MDVTGDGSKVRCYKEQYILPKVGYNIKYIAYCLQSLDLSKYKQGAAIPHIYFRDYGERLIKVEENLVEQERIVSLLDLEFANIDAIKANAEKQLQDAKYLCISLKQHVCVLIAQSCPTLCGPMNCSPPGSCVHGILRQEYWSRLPFPPPRGLPNPGIKPQSPILAGGFFTV